MGGVGGCRKFSGRNCYGSGNNYESCQGQHGGYSSAPDAYSYRTTSLWDCTHICNGDWSCHAVVYMPSQSKCYFRNYVNIGACAWSSGHDHFDTYVCKWDGVRESFSLPALQVLPMSLAAR